MQVVILSRACHPLNESDTPKMCNNRDYYWEEPQAGRKIAQDEGLGIGIAGMRF